MRLIDADALGIGNAKREVFEKPEYADGWNAAIEIIENAPTIDAVPVVHGRWEKADNLKPKCSVCGKFRLYAWPDYKICDYCPNCGAKMDLEVDDDG